MCINITINPFVQKHIYENFFLKRVSSLTKAIHCHTKHRLALKFTS